MAFMNAEVTDKQDWILVDGGAGVCAIDADSCGLSIQRIQALLTLADESGCEEDAAYAAECLVAMLHDYCEPGTFRSGSTDIPNIEIRIGYGVRSSASGYLDCTPWTVYSTKAEALRAAREEQRQCEGID